MSAANSNAPALAPHVLDAIAAALSDDVLTPYVAPARPFTVGTKATYGIRAEYRAQSPSGDLTPHVDPAITRVAERVAAALGHARVVDITTLMPDAAIASAVFEPDAVRDQVVLCADLLQRVADPAPLLNALVSALAHATVAVVAVPLRALFSDTDDLGPPRNPAYAREWTFPELQAGLDAYGLEPLFGGLLPTDASTSHNDARQQCGIIIVTTRTVSARE